MNDKKYTCPICDDILNSKDDGVLRRCQCGMLGVDATPEYVRFVGITPKEDPSYEKIYKEKSEIILKARKHWNNNKMN